MICGKDDLEREENTRSLFRTLTTRVSNTIPSLIDISLLSPSAKGKQRTEELPVRKKNPDGM